MSNPDPPRSVWDLIHRHGSPRHVAAALGFDREAWEARRREFLLQPWMQIFSDPRRRTLADAIADRNHVDRTLKEIEEGSEDG